MHHQNILDMLAPHRHRNSTNPWFKKRGSTGNSYCGGDIFSNIILFWLLM